MRDDGDKAKQVLPFASYDSDDPEDLWRWMAGYEDKTGGRVFAIPHNGNLSNGVMFATETLSGRRIDRDYAEQRSMWEPLYEATQMKGDGEAHPLLVTGRRICRLRELGSWQLERRGEEAGNAAARVRAWRT